MKLQKKETCEVQRDWLEGLVCYLKAVEKAQGAEKTALTSALLGYASSAETILKYL